MDLTTLSIMGIGFTLGTLDALNHGLMNATNYKPLRQPRFLNHLEDLTQDQELRLRRRMTHTASPAKGLTPS